MAVVHLFDGEKGGVGKSTFGKTVCHYFETNSIEFVLVDADPNNPDVAEVYGGITNIHFKVADDATAIASKQSALVDKIFEMAFEKTVLVNLPANVHEQVAYWIESNNLLDSEFASQVKICKWFLSNGSYNSVTLFLNSLEKYQGKLAHCFVRNNGICWDWETVEQREDFKQAQEKYRFGDIIFSGLRATERDYLEKNRQPFKLALQDEKLPILSRQRLAKFLRSSKEAIEIGLQQLEQWERREEKQEVKSA